MNEEQTRQALVGEWISLAPEIRPSAAKNPDGTLKPFYLKREIKYMTGDRFELSIVNSADPDGAVPLAKIDIKGHMIWRGPHLVADGAQKVDCRFAEPGCREGLRQVDRRCNPGVFGKSFAPFGLVEGRNFMEFDLVYLSHDLLF